MIILKLASENAGWWAQLGHTLDTGSIQSAALIRSLQGFSHFQPYYWILSQYTEKMKPVLTIEFNVWCLYLGTGNHYTVVEQIKESEAEEASVLQHPSLVFGRDQWNILVSLLQLLSQIKVSNGFRSHLKSLYLYYLYFSQRHIRDDYIVFYSKGD